MMLLNLNLKLLYLFVNSLTGRTLNNMSNTNNGRGKKRKNYNGKNEKEQKMTPAQKETMIQFMEDHPDFAVGKFLGAEGRRKTLELWSELTRILNAIDGPKKSAKKWQRAWTDQRQAVRRKIDSIKAHRRGTGGGPQTTKKLTELDQRVEVLLPKESIHGIQDPSGLPLDSEQRPQVAPISASVVAAAIEAAKTPLPSPSTAACASNATTFPSTSMDAATPVETFVPVTVMSPEPLTPATPLDDLADTDITEWTPSPGPSRSVSSDSEPAAPRRERIRVSASSRGRRIGTSPAVEAARRFEDLGGELNVTLQRIQTAMETQQQTLDALLDEQRRSNAAREETNTLLAQLIQVFSTQPQ